MVRPPCPCPCSCSSFYVILLFLPKISKENGARTSSSSNFQTAAPKERRRRRRGRVLRVRIVLYSGSIEGFSERDVRKSNTIRQRRIRDTQLPISKRRRRKNVCRCPPSPWPCPPGPYRALQGETDGLQLHSRRSNVDGGERSGDAMYVPESLDW